MKNRLYETMTRVRMKKGLTVRVWCSSPYFTIEPDNEVVLTLGNLSAFDHLTISAALDRLPQVTAYEILDVNGNGGIVYPDWK